MIRYETVRDHLDRQHWWTPTYGLTWRELVEVHEEKHQVELEHPAPPAHRERRRSS